MLEEREESRRERARKRTRKSVVCEERDRARARERNFIDNQEATKVGKHSALSGNTASARTGPSI